jgi:hypothetical protein
MRFLLLRLVWPSISSCVVIARSDSDEAIQTISAEAVLDCFATLAMTGLSDGIGEAFILFGNAFDGNVGA